MSISLNFCNVLMKLFARHNHIQIFANSAARIPEVSVVDLRQVTGMFSAELLLHYLGHVPKAVCVADVALGAGRGLHTAVIGITDGYVLIVRASE